MAAAIPVNALLVAFLTIGEEIGWRGWLLPALRPLGIWPALLISGAIWGLWHTPLILLGYNFNRTDMTGVALMTIGAVMWGVVFGWVRLRSASVWPAVFFHAAFNASGAFLTVLPAAGSPMEMALVNPLGVSGWIVCAIVIVMLIVTGQLRKEPYLSPPSAPRPAAP